MKNILLTISLILGATATSAEIKVGEILGTGKVISQFDQPSKRCGPPPRYKASGPSPQHAQASAWRRQRRRALRCA